MKNILFTMILCCVVFTIQGQQAIPITGGKATGPGGSCSYSVGQLFYTINIGAGVVSQGVQQSVEIYNVTNSKPNTKSIASIYPNPTTDYVVLELHDAIFSEVSYVLCDLHGREFEKGSTVHSSKKIDMRNLAQGTYVLKVSHHQHKKKIKTFKIIKKA